MPTTRTHLDLLALAALPYVAVDVDPVRLYEKFLLSEYPSPPAEDLVAWVTEELARLAIDGGYFTG